MLFNAFQKFNLHYICMLNISVSIISYWGRLVLSSLYRQVLPFSVIQEVLSTSIITLSMCTVQTAFQRARKFTASWSSDVSSSPLGGVVSSMGGEISLHITQERKKFNQFFHPIISYKMSFHFHLSHEGYLVTGLKKTKFSTTL